MRTPRSLRARIALAALAALALVGVLAAAVLLAAIEREGRRAVDRDLAARAQRLVEHPGPIDGPGPIEGPRSLLAGSGQFVQVALGGRVVRRQGDVPVDPPAVPDHDGFATVDIGGTPWRSLTLSGGAVRVQLLASLASVRDRVASTRRLVVLLGLAALLLTGAAAWAFTSLALRPLRRLQEGAARVGGARDLATPLPDEGPDEVRALAGALNGMLGRLQASTAATERALDATRRFAADAGHELRTPLTGLRANLDALERNPSLSAADREALLRDTIAEQERIVHLLEGLQALARGEAAERIAREPVELDEVLDAAVYAARRRHPEVTFELAGDGDATVSGWGGGLRLVADNLLDNAALHGRPGGHVRVGLGRDDGAYVLRVEDDGPGLPADERETVLAPFARGSGTTAQGSGLGLAIVAQQVALHGGSLRLNGSAALGGLEVEIRLPATAAARSRSASSDPASA